MGEIPSQNEEASLGCRDIALSWMSVHFLAPCESIPDRLLALRSEKVLSKAAGKAPLGAGRAEPFDKECDSPVCRLYPSV